MALKNAIDTFLDTPDARTLEGDSYHDILLSYQKLLEEGAISDKIHPGTIGEQIQSFITELKRDPSSSTAGELYTGILGEFKKLGEKHFKKLKEAPIGDTTEQLTGILEFLEVEKKRTTDVGAQAKIENAISELTVILKFIQAESTNPKDLEKLEAFYQKIEQVYTQAIEKTGSKEAKDVLIKQLSEIQNAHELYKREKQAFIDTAAEKIEEGKGNLLFEAIDLFGYARSNGGGLYPQLMRSNIPNIQIAFDQISELEGKEHKDVIEIGKSLTLSRREPFFGNEVPPGKTPFNDAEISRFDASQKQIVEHLKTLIEEDPHFVDRLKKRYPELKGKNQGEIENFLVDKFLVDFAISQEKSSRQIFNQVQNQVGKGGKELAIGDNIITFENTQERDTAATSALILLHRLNVEIVDGEASYLLYWSTSAIGSYLEFYLGNGIDAKGAVQKGLVTLGFLIIPLIYSRGIKKSSAFVYKEDFRILYNKLLKAKKTPEEIQKALSEKGFNLSDSEIEELERKSKVLDYYEDIAKKTKNKTLDAQVKEMRLYDLFTPSRFFYTKIEASTWPLLKTRRFTGKILPFISGPGNMFISDSLKWIGGRPSWKEGRKWYNPLSWTEGAEGRVLALMKNDFLEKLKTHSLVSEGASRFAQDFVRAQKDDMSTTELRTAFTEIYKNLDELQNQGLNDNMKDALKQATEVNIGSILSDTSIKDGKVKLKNLNTSIELHIKEVQEIKTLEGKIPKVFAYIEDAVDRRGIEGLLDTKDTGKTVEILKRDVANLKKLETTTYTDLHDKLLIEGESGDELNTEFLKRFNEHLDALKVLEAAKKTDEMDALKKRFVDEEKRSTDMPKSTDAKAGTDAKDTPTEEPKTEEPKTAKDKTFAGRIDARAASIRDAWRKLGAKRKATTKKPKASAGEEPKASAGEKPKASAGKSLIDREGAIDVDFEDIDPEEEKASDGKSALDRAREAVRDAEARFEGVPLEDKSETKKGLEEKAKLEETIKNRQHAVDWVERAVIQLEDIHHLKMKPTIIANMKKGILAGEVPTSDLNVFEKEMKGNIKQSTGIDLGEIKTRQEFARTYRDKNIGILDEKELREFDKAMKGEEFDRSAYGKANWIKYIRQATRG